MKKYIIAIVFIASCIGDVAAQLPVLEMGQRKADLYYWDTNWLDCRPMCNPVPNSSGGGFYSVFYDMYIGRPCVTQEPMKIIGIAAPVEIILRPNTIDTSMSGRLPEYFILYQMEGDSFYFKSAVRWDTATPKYQMEIRHPISQGQGSRFDVYEAYFEKPQIVHDTFIVGGHNAQ